MNPLATARQLWRLNKEGRLLVAVNEEGAVQRWSPITAEEADAAIKAVVSGAVVAAARSARSKHS